MDSEILGAEEFLRSKLWAAPLVLQTGQSFEYLGSMFGRNPPKQFFQIIHQLLFENSAILSFKFF